MTITKQTVANQIAAYLHHEMTLAQLVDWAENAMMDGEFSEREMSALRSVVSRLGVADVRAFGLSWEDCEHFLHKLGYTTRVDVVAAKFLDSLGLHFQKGQPKFLNNFLAQNSPVVIFRARFERLKRKI
jgi:hypothetical protein